MKKEEMRHESVWMMAEIEIHTHTHNKRDTP
jgi:hypothetical protein